MAKANITANVRMKNNIGVIDIAGEVNGAAEESLMQAFNMANSHGATVILLNFSNLEYMNSSGIGLLVTLLIRANRNKQQLLACGLSAHYQEIFALTRLDEAITIFENEAQAVIANR